MSLWEYFTGKYAINDVNAMKTACDETVKQIKKAKYLIDFTKGMGMDAGAAQDTLKKAEKYLGSVSKTIANGHKLYGVTQTYDRVMKAHKVLSHEHALRFNRDEAIVAMTVLIKEFGTVATNFPPPANKYGTVLIKVAESLKPTVEMLVPQMRKTQRAQWAQLGFSIAQ